MRQRWQRLTQHEDWNIGVVTAPIHTFLGTDAPPEVKWFPPNKRNLFRADPFAVVRDGVTHVFFEAFDYRINRGYIQHCTLGPDGTPGEVETVLDLPVHLSYPYLFRNGNRIYMLPETYQANEAALYTATDFPRGWEKTKTLIKDFPALDSTVFEFEGCWWLICTRYDDPDPFELHIWYADDLLGIWTPHSGNPVKRDVGSTRPAGTPFVHEGDLYRPAQDCSRAYGGAVVLNKVVKLTPTEFEEVPIARVEPDQKGPYRHGLHTLSSVGDFTLLDGAGRKCVPREMRRILTARAR